MNTPVRQAPATEAEIRRFVTRLRLDVGLLNLLGAAVLVLGGLLIETDARAPDGAFEALWIAAFVLPPWVAGIAISNRLSRPLVDWLREGRAGQPAPDHIQRLVLAHPALRSVVLLGLWWLTAVALAIADVAIGPADPWREFLGTLTGVGVAGIVVSTLSFLADQRVLGPWYDRFFAGDDPTRHRLPSTRVRRRLLVMFVLGTALPLALVGGVVSERLRTPGGEGQLEVIVWFLVAVGMVSGLSLILSIRHSITRPLSAMRAAAHQVRGGDLSVRVPVESADEFGELAMAFNAMVDGLRERRRVEDLLGRQVGGAVAEKVIEEGVTFTVERRDATVLFLDLVGFTTLAQRLEPEGVVETLNRVFDTVIREVDARQGLVNKFMGDAVLAVFGAPLDDPDHAAHALGAARAIADALDRDGIGYGIGVSTGPVVAGNVGAAERFEYTVVGDAVNEAERLQELTRQRDVSVLVSGSTAQALGEQNGLVRHGDAVLRGRTTPTELYAFSR